MRCAKVLLLVSSLMLLPCTTLWGQPYQGPIIDAHGYLGASFNWEIMVEAMDRNNVTQRTVMARYYPGGPRDLPGSDEDAVRLAGRYPGRFFPLVGMQLPLLTGSHKWRSPDREVERLIAETERKLASGRFFGIGEFIVRHWSYSSGPHAEQENPIYSTFTRRMSAIAARFEAPMVVHMEGYPALVDDFSRLLAEYPNARFVWAHNCGRSKVPVIRSMLARHPNLFCDLAGMTNVGTTGYGTGWPRMEEFTALIEQDGVLYPDMKALYEEFPDRFMLGMDVAHAPGNNLQNYSRRVNRFRDLLGQLKPQTAKKFAETNAIRIFKLSSAVRR
ncbi:MAG: amidohydrolase family protein [Betaproteobacteria bacterium]|nr:amidohydrolase family protein [Betaproteobacteria bacterium]